MRIETTQVWDAGPILAISPFVPTPFLALDVYPSLNGRYDNAASGIPYYATGIGPTICQSASAVIVAAKNIMSGSYFYGIFASNSNSFANSILQEGGIFLPAPPDSPGWNSPLIPTPGPVLRMGPGF